MTSDLNNFLSKQELGHKINMLTSIKNSLYQNDLLIEYLTQKQQQDEKKIATNINILKEKIKQTESDISIQYSNNKLNDNNSYKDEKKIIDDLFLNIAETQQVLEAKQKNIDNKENEVKLKLNSLSKTKCDLYHKIIEGLLSS